MRTIVLFLYPDGRHYMARTVPDDMTGEAWPIRHYIEADRDYLEALIIWPGDEGTQTYRFTWDGSNWSTAGAPIAIVRGEIDLFV